MKCRSKVIRKGDRFRLDGFIVIADRRCPCDCGQWNMRMEGGSLVGVFDIADLERL